MSERLTDEQVATMCARIARALNDPARPVAGVIKDAGDVIYSLHREVQAMRALLNGGPCEACEGRGWIVEDRTFGQPEGERHQCPNPACIDGRVPGVIEQLEAIRRAGESGYYNIALDSLAAVTAPLRQHGGPSDE